MYQPIYQHRRPKRMGSYFMPFLSIIILGLIGVLVFQIVTYFQEKHASALENKAAVKIVAGRADMKIWGVDQWTTAIDGSILNEGDQVRTSAGSRVVLTLLNGSVVRLNSDSEVELTGLKSRDGEDEASFTLKNGEIWLKHSEKDTVKTTFGVATANFNVEALGTTFDVSQSSTLQTARVIDGKVRVEVKVDDPDTQKMRTTDTVEVALGQEINLSSSDVTDLKNRKPVDFLALLADDFRSGEWYMWNRSEDSTGASSVSVSDAVNQLQGTQPTIAGMLPSLDGITPSEVTEVIPTGPLTPPVIVSPASSNQTTKTGTIAISGTVSAQTDKVEVTYYDPSGKIDTYVLQKYQSGSTSWSYIASSDYSNLMAGSNRYAIVAIGKDSTRSEPTEITIVYDKPLQPADLSAPKVVSFNGTTSSEVDTNSVKVVGTIGKGIPKVYVNNFVLTKYQMDSGTWTYFAKTEYGNLKDGENLYEVYGVDSDGKKTPVTKFTITKKSVETTVAPPPAPAAPAPQPSPPPAPTPPPPQPVSPQPRPAL